MVLKTIRYVIELKAAGVFGIIALYGYGYQRIA